MSFIDAFPEPPTPTSTSDRLNFIFDIIPAGLFDNAKKLWEPRLKVDGTEVQIMGTATPSETEEQIGWNLTVTLLKPSQYSLFTNSASIDFGFGQKIAGAWDAATFVTILTGAKVHALKRTKVGPQNNPQDAVTVTIVSNDLDRLAKTAERGLIIYDSDRTNISDADLKPILDVDGHSYTPEIIPIPGLKLSDIFAEVFLNRCDFDWVKTDLPADDYPILQYRVNIGQRFYDGVKGFVGMYSAAITPLTNGDGDGIWITDTTIVQPAGFPTPKRVSVDQAISIELGTERQRLDALILQYSSLENNYDYTTFDFKNSTTVKGAVETDVERITIEFRKITSPTTNVIVRTALNIENKVTTLNGIEIDESSDDYEFDGKGRVNRQTKTIKKLLPTGGVTYSTSAMQNVRTEEEEYSYAPHPFRPRTDITERRDFHSRGLMAKIVDTVIATTGAPLQMEATKAHRSGYLANDVSVTDVILSEAAILSRSETAEPLRDGTVRVHVFEVDELTGLVIRDDTENRPGEVGLSGQHTSNDELIVYAAPGGTRSVDRVESLSIQELPLKYGIPLGRRILKQRQSDAGTVNIPVLGWDETLRKGFPITAVDPRNGADLGTFLITGRSITIDKTGLVMNLTGRAMAASTQPPAEIERYATVIQASTAQTFSVSLLCLAGNGISLDPTNVSNLSIEARHVEIPARPWVNLEAGGSIDLAEWDGNTEPFEIRVTASAVAAVIREDFGIVIGPTMVPDFPVLLGEGHGHGSGTTLTLPATVPFGSDKILVVGIGNRNQGVPTGVTYNGVAMTAISAGAGSIGTRITSWYLINPPEGTANIVATYGLSQLLTDAVYAVFGNVNQTTPISNFRTGTAGGANANMNIADFTGKGIVDFLNKWGEIFTTPKHNPVPGAGQTTVDIFPNPSDDSQCLASSFAVNGDTTHMAWTISPSVGDSNYSQVAVGLNTVAQV
jgi:hypothetical protein